MRTWHFEMIVVAGVLIAVVVWTGNQWLEWIGAAAVLCTFGHASVGFRMSEQVEHYERQTGQTVVTCYEWSTRYFVMKEALWFAYFALLGAYSALVGVFIFLLYPAWRRVWRRRKPYQPEVE